ncbi:MAG TPA: hypothetical protein VGB85_25465 [Nannocystis sp.]|jgi:hypothetical protein
MGINTVEKWVVSSDPGERKLWIVPVVNPQGSIKYVRVSPHVQSGIVAGIYDERAMDPRLATVQLKPGLSESGWAFLADLYAEDGLGAAWEAHRQWMRSGPMMGAASAVKPFPEKYLPSGVHDRRAGKADHQVEADEIVIPEMDNRPVHTSKAKKRAAGMD